MGSTNYTDETKQALQQKLFDWLDAHGPATKHEICKGLKWGISILDFTLGSQPEWLVAAGVRRSGSKMGRLILYHCKGEHAFGFCKCGRKLFRYATKKQGICHSCAGFWKKESVTREVPGVDVAQPTDAAAGSEEKIQILEARMDAGLPLWLDADNQTITSKSKCYQPGDDWNDN